MDVAINKDKVIEQVKKILQKGTDKENKAIKNLSESIILNDLFGYIVSPFMKIMKLDLKINDKNRFEAKKIFKEYFPYWSDTRAEEEINFYLKFNTFQTKKILKEAKVVAKYLEIFYI